MNEEQPIDQFFTLEDLRMIRAMVLTACPWAGEDASQMPESFAKVYRVTCNKIKNVEQAQRAMPYPDESQGVRCRTMGFQRPCGSVACNRPECN